MPPSRQNKSDGKSSGARQKAGASTFRQAFNIVRGTVQLLNRFMTQGWDALLGDSDDEEQVENAEDDDGVDMTNETYFGNVRGEIFGLRYYYNVEVSRNEAVILVRQPENQYAPNAIRVENSEGVQIGHLKRELAAALAPLIDNKLVRIEGRVPTNKNTYSMVVNLTLYGRQENRKTVQDTLQKHGYPLSIDEAGQEYRRNYRTGASNTLTPEFEYAANMLRPEFEYVNLNKELDEMFEHLRDDQLLQAEAVDYVKTALYPHQKQALAWMIKRENCDDLPPFWSEIQPSSAATTALYSNSLTRMVTNRRPETVRGGILADDMGLGKTLEIIALIVSNGPDGEPLQLGESQAVPAAGRKRKSAEIGALVSAARMTTRDLMPLQKLKSLTGAMQQSQYRNFDLKNGTDGLNSPVAGCDMSLKSVSVAEYDENGLSVLDDDQVPPVNADAYADSHCDGPKATLIICSMSVMHNWEDQLRGHLSENAYSHLRIHRQCGPGMADAESLSNMDIVITTFQTMASAWKGHNDPLFEVQWLRVVLDDAHILLRNPLSQTAKAACDLKAQRRWALTGTPLQNRVLDLWYIIKFLRVKPLDQRAFWRQYIEKPITEKSVTGLNCIRILMKALVMRRTKNQEIEPGRPLVPLPNKTFTLETVEFTADERALYESLLQKARAAFEGYLGNPISFYDRLLSNLRNLFLICCHPDLSERMRKIKFSNAFLGLLESKRSVAQKVDKKKAQRQNWRSSAKVDALIVHLVKTHQESPSGKCIVVSEYTDFLDIIETSLLTENFTFVRLNEPMTANERVYVLETFQSKAPGTATIILLSMKAVGVGLNLTAASKIFFMDPAWNPAVEEQIVDCCHHLGQNSDVTIVKFIIGNSVEELMLEEVKRAITEEALAGKKNRPEDDLMVDVSKLLS